MVAQKHHNNQLNNQKTEVPPETWATIKIYPNKKHWKTAKKKRMFPKIGVFPPEWMVKIMENRIKMDDFGVPLFSETSKQKTHSLSLPHVYLLRKLFSKHVFWGLYNYLLRGLEACPNPIPI